MSHFVLLSVALFFALLNGVNDGGALVAMGLKIRVMRPITAILVVACAVSVAPLLFGTGVANTVAVKLVPFGGEDGQAALLVALTAAMTVAAVLAWRRLPTSLTLATNRP